MITQDTNTRTVQSNWFIFMTIYVKYIFVVDTKKVIPLFLYAGFFSLDFFHIIKYILLYYMMKCSFNINNLANLSSNSQYWFIIYAEAVRIKIMCHQWHTFNWYTLNQKQHTHFRLKAEYEDMDQSNIFISILSQINSNKMIFYINYRNSNKKIISIKSTILNSYK